MYDLEPMTKAERRAKKKRPRMKMHGASLRHGSKHAGMKAVKQKRKK